MCSRLFACGTLRVGCAPAEIAGAVARLRPEGRGVARGRLIDLDAYESFDACNPSLSLFVRRRVRVRVEGGRQIVCWAYEYNRAGEWHDRAGELLERCGGDADAG